MKKELLLVAVGTVLGFAGAVSYSTFAQREDFAKRLESSPGTVSLISSGGQCEYGRSQEGMWHQQGEGRETSGNYRPRCGQFGLGFKPAESKWGFEAMYVDGGKATLNAIAIAYPDDDASKHNASIDTLRQQCRNEPAPECAQRIRGSGGVKGFNLVATYDLFQVGKVIVEGGAGLFFYRASWDVRVLPLDPDCLGDDNKCKWQAQINQKTGWLVSPNAHLKLKYDWIFFQAQRQFRTDQHAPISAGFSKTHRAFLVGLEIPFWSL